MRSALAALFTAALPVIAGGCQLVSGLSDYKSTGSGGGGAGGTTTTTAGSAGTTGGGGTTSSGGSAGTTGGGGSGGMIDPCMNGAQDGEETAVDCGGPTCNKCDVDKTCKQHSDCTSELCLTGVCKKVTHLEAGNAHVCAMVEIDATTHSLYCWGSDAHGQLGNNTTGPSFAPVPAVPGINVTSMSLGGPPDDRATGHTCVKDQNDRLYCWGANLHGQLGTGDTSDLSSLPVMPVLPVQSFTAGGEFTCAIKKSNGAVACWGSDQYGQLEDGGGADVTSPKETSILPAGGVSPTSLAAGMHHACVRFSDGGVSCWGRNNRYQVGQIGAGPLKVTAVDKIANALTLRSGGDTSCVLAAADLLCWGDTSDGQIVMPMIPAYTLAKTLAVSGASAIAVGSDGDVDGVNDPLGGHLCAVLPTGKVSCWGDNRHGQLGRGTVTPMEIQPAEVSGVSGAVEVVAGAEFSCALLDTGAVRCWGRDDLRQLGTITLTDSQSTPVSVAWP